MKKLAVSFAIIISVVSVCFAQNKKADNPKLIDQTVGRNDRPLEILEIPKPAYPDRCISGTVRVRVEFIASGKIGKIFPVSQLGYGAMENAVEAAKKIKFEAAIKDGKAVTVIKIIPFSFTIY